MPALANNHQKRVAARISRAGAILALGVVAWVCATEWGGVVHGHPAYAVLLGATTLVSIAVLVSAGARERRAGRWRAIGRVALTVLAVLWLVLVGWLRPHTATDPSLTAMESDAAVAVTESVTSISFSPAHGNHEVGVFFQPGALVDARAYAAVLRPLAEAGHTVVIAKQPLGIAFLAQGAFGSAQSSFPDVTTWVIGGHSLGGTVAAMTAQDAAPHSAVAGLLLFASYPANDISAMQLPTASISGSADGLSTPAKIAASKQNLPGDTVFTVIEGASHAQFGDYGKQSGDGTPTISDADARARISTAALAFVDEVSESMAVADG